MAQSTAVGARVQATQQYRFVHASPWVYILHAYDGTVHGGYRIWPAAGRAETERERCGLIVELKDIGLYF